MTASRLTVVFAALLFATMAWAVDLPRYAVILSDPAPITARARGGRPAVEAARTRVLAAQGVVREELRSRGIRITGSSHTLLNAIFVEAEPEAADQLKSIPGVGRVARLTRFHLDLDRAVQLINVPAAWNMLGGTSNAGAGVRIGIIDTGIEATHPAFQESSITPPAGFPVCQVLFATYPQDQWFDCTAADSTKGLPLCASVNCAFTNNKVIVARSYVPILSATTSRADDPSPRDRVGHGTAVAMAAAGVTNTGPSDTITGVAPQAFLGSYKVFGSPDVNSFATSETLIHALEDALNDGMDIAVLSLGAPALAGPLDTCGSGPCDPEAYAVQNAVNAGMVVVSAAGNQGETGQLGRAALGTIDSPGDAPGAIAVAATTNSHTWGYVLTVNGLGTYYAQFGDGPRPGSTVTGQLGDVASVGDPLGCSVPPAGSLSGLIVLVARGTCNFAVKILGLQAAGAAGAIITNSPGDDTLLTPGGLNGTTIPAVFIGYHDGQAIRTFLSGNSKAAISISPNLGAFSVTNYNQVAPFSSHGPVPGTGALKPDVAAVGVDLYLAGQRYDPNGELYSANGYLVSQGTSFSTPQVAGVAALVKQRYPNLSALQINSAVINTATRDVTENGGTASALGMGAGRVNAGFAVTNTLIVTPTNASFRVIKSTALPVTLSFQLTNIGTTGLTLKVSLTRLTPEVNAQTSINLPNLTLAPGETNANLSLMLSGTLPAPGIYEGFMTIQGAPNPVTIPYVYIVGDGVPANLISMAGNGDGGTVGQQTAGGYVVLRVVDQYGVPVPDLPVAFSVSSGGGQVKPLAKATDKYGTAIAESILGPNPGTNVYTATAGALTASFVATGLPQPSILPDGAVNAANYAVQPLAPGSYIALFGNNLAASTSTYNTPYLPVALNRVSVSFANPNVSAAGHIVFVSPGQINVQVPWELQGQPSVQVTVTNADSSGVAYTLPLQDHSPALFEIPSGGQNIAAALDENNNIVTASNPVARGRIVQLFANGLGPVNNQPASGDPAPVNPLATTTTTPVVTIGGVDAEVKFSGMTPGNAALYQVNAVVPETGLGLQPVTISIGGAISAPSLLPVQ